MRRRGAIESCLARALQRLSKTISEVAVSAPKLRTLGIFLLCTAAPAAAVAQPITDWEPFVDGVYQLATGELTNALTQAYALHIRQARPLPDDVKRFLRGIIPDEFIERARFTVSTDPNSLPGILNQGHRTYMGQDNAVSIDNLIIFSREPTLNAATDARWWAHELGHHIQYRRWGGIPGFARRYVLDFQGIESEAETYGELAIRKYIEEHP